ncbi:MAG TPA: hypothetical protein PL158_08005 [Bacillota bacterium]|nr:hypothetical protein [Bacillota bacterium]
MFEKMPNQAQRLNETRNGQSEVDLSRFVDPLAKQIGWDFIGHKRITYGIVAADYNRIEFRITWDTQLKIILIFNFCFLAAIPFLAAFHPEIYLKYKHLFFPLMVAGSLIIWGCVLYFYKDLIVFDKRRGYFWKGSNEELFYGDIGIDYVKLERIHALQLITGIVRVKSYTEYGRYLYPYRRTRHHYYQKNELNLVSDNGERMNVVHHRNKNRIQKDAQVLSKFLGVPIWEEKKTESETYVW